MEKKKKRLKSSTYKLLVCIIIFAGYVLLTLPTVADSVSRIGQSASITDYVDSVDEMSDDALAEEMAKCVAYNEQLYEKRQTTPYRYQGANETDAEYESLLDTDGTGKMAILTVPDADIELAIGHGTTEELMNSSAGHLYGTSLPVGGTNTHAVITGHTGLKRSKLFTDLDEMEIGDIFEIEVLGETHRYQVDQIEVVLPEDADDYLQIEEGKDLVTLYTCTPYGVNSHRLLVRGTRIADPIETISGTLHLDASTMSAKQYVLLALWAVLPIGLMVIICKFVLKDPSAKKKNKKNRKRRKTKKHEEKIT